MAEVVSNTYAPPEWMNQDFLQAALRKGLRRDSLNVSSCCILPATNVGDNYLSQMFRASASVESKRKGAENLSVVIKSMPKGERIEKYVNEAKFFSTEAKMLSETLPILQKILDEIHGPKLFADLYFQQDEPNSLLILEDLCLSGYRSADRIKGLDLHHSILLVESLAVFHAASLVAIKLNPQIAERYALGAWQKHNETNVRKFISQTFKPLLECFEVWGSFPNSLYEKLQKLEDSAFDKLILSTETNEDGFNVLNHGDPWTSNFLFKYINGTPSHVAFVDFQLSCINSPVYDLLYFLFTSPSNKIKITHLNQLLQCYHTKLTGICQKLNHPLKYSLGDLRQDFFQRLFFGFYISIALFPFMTSESKNVTELDDYLDETKEHGIQMHLSDNFKKSLEIVLPFFDEQGILD